MMLLLLHSTDNIRACNQSFHWFKIFRES